jgi:hypothetical protein
VQEGATEDVGAEARRGGDRYAGLAGEGVGEASGPGGVASCGRQFPERLVADGDEPPLDLGDASDPEVGGELVDRLEGTAGLDELVGASQDELAGSHGVEATGRSSGGRGHLRALDHAGGQRSGSRRGSGGPGLQHGGDRAADAAGGNEGAGVVGEERTGASELPPSAVVAVVEEHAVTIA